MPDTALNHDVTAVQEHPVLGDLHAEVKLQRLRDILLALETQRTQLSGLCRTAAAMNTKAEEEREEGDGDGDDEEHAKQIVSQALVMAQKTNQDHIRLLTQYNDIKDVATSLIGMIAEARQKRIIEVMQDFDVDEID